jgi:TPR repeat protein
MRQIQIRVVIFLFFVLWSESLFATAQQGDKLVVNGDTAWINSNPLEKYFEEKGKRTIGEFDLNSRECFSTSLWRGYVATWKLENDSLFLIRIQTEYCSGSNPKEINIKSEFGSNKVFAQWVTDTIVCPQGELLQYVHMGYESIYEGEKYYTFKQGKRTDTKEINYLEKDNALLFPGEKFLRDTIKTAILKSIDKVEIDSLNEKALSRILMVFFDDDRKISHISFGSNPQNINEKIILRNAKKALKNFPELMKVNHKWYFPPRIQMSFNEHCLKFPYDIKYGCEEFSHFRTGVAFNPDTLINPKLQNELGDRYYSTRTYDEAVKWYQKSAEQGYAEAQFNLGLMYQNGFGVIQDDNEAVKWFRKSAEQGNADAQCYLGFMYERGLGITQDYNEAVKWYRKSAEQGNAQAQYNLGIMYEDGNGVTQDYSEAVKWYRKSAEQGNTRAQYNLGRMYEEGNGVTQDFEEVVKWFQKKAEQGNTDAQYILGSIYYKKARELLKNRDYEGALEQINLSINVAPNPYYFKGGRLDTRGETYFNLEEYEKCIKDMDKAISIKESDNSYYIRGLAKLKIGEKDEGCKDLLKAGELGNTEAYQIMLENCKE